MNDERTEVAWLCSDPSLQRMHSHSNAAFPALLFVDFQAERAQKGSAAFKLCQVLGGSLLGSAGMFKCTWG